MEVRLQKVIAASGLASRRKAEEWIAQGRVTINGKIVRELGTRIDPERDHVKVDGRHLKDVEPYAYLLLNKPKGIVSTLNDPEGRPTIDHLSAWRDASHVSGRSIGFRYGRTHAADQSR